MTQKNSHKAKKRKAASSSTLYRKAPKQTGTRAGINIVRAKSQGVETGWYEGKNVDTIVKRLFGNSQYIELLESHDSNDPKMYTIAKYDPKAGGYHVLGEITDVEYWTPKASKKKSAGTLNLKMPNGRRVTVRR